jgi:hypothetical protein
MDATLIPLKPAQIILYFAFVNFFFLIIKKIYLYLDEDGIQNEVDLKIQHCSSMLYLYIYINNTNLSDPNSYGQIQVEEEDDGIIMIIKIFSLMIDFVLFKMKFALK